MPEEKTYYCRKTDSAITIDGNIAKPEWDRAEAVNLVETCTGNSPIQSTSVKLLWDDTYLYAAFSCNDDYINATMTGYNDLLYLEEVVEIFLDDDCDMKTYVEFEVNPLNALLHYFIYNDLNGRAIGYARNEKTVITAVNTDSENNRWDVEMAIPLSEFVTAPNIPPKPGDRWLMNLYRIDRPKAPDKIEFTSWSPIGKANYHTPQKFGVLEFVG